MTAKLFEGGALGALLALGGIGLTEMLLAIGFRPVSPLGWSGVGTLIGAVLGGLPAALAGAATAFSYATLQFLAPQRFPEFFGNPFNFLAWAVGLGLLAAGCVWLRNRVDRLQETGAELRASEARFRSLTAMSSDWYWEIDSELRFTRIAGAGLGAFGLSEDQVIGKRSLDVPGYELISPGIDEFQRLRAKRLPYRDVRGVFALADGGRRYVSVDGDPILDSAGRFGGYRGVARDITSKMEAEQVIRDSEARFRALFELSPDAIVVHSGSVVLYVNAAALKLFGAAGQEAIVGMEANNLAFPESLPEREKRLDYLLANPGASIPFADRKYRRLDGTPVDVEVAAYSYMERSAIRVVLVARDITARKRAEDALRDSEARYRALFELSPDPIVVTNGRIILFANSATIALARASSTSDIVGKEAMHFVHPDSAPLVRERLGKLLSAPGTSVPFVDMKYRDIEGGMLQVEAGAASFSEAGEIRVLISMRDITARKHAEQALASAKERLQRALESSDLSLWETDLRTGEVYLSEGWSELIGGPAEATRTTVDELMRLVHPVDLAATVLLSKETILGKREAYSTEHRVRTHAGGWKWIRSAGKVSERDADGRALRMSGTNLDITARKLAENALRESEERFRSLTNMSSDWYWEQDEGFRFTFMSGRLREKTGIDQQSHLGRTRWEMPASNVTEADWLRHKALLERHEPFVDFVMRRPDADGLQHWVSISGEPVFDEMKRFRGYRGIGRDVNAEHLARERIEHLNSELEERVRMRTAELETLVKELETFHFAVAHDLNTSLGVMSVNAGMLLHELGAGLAEEHQRALREITQNAELTARLLDDLLAYSRLGQETLNLETVPMELLARDVWRRLSREKSERQLLFETTGLPACRGDQRMLSQLWSRLLSNAIKFTRTREQARIEAGYDASRNAFFVRDNGVGFDMQYADRLFGVFERLHHGENFEGTGVGLAIVARIARRHGGRVWAQARPGEGATFWFTISGEAAP